MLNVSILDPVVLLVAVATVAIPCHVFAHRLKKATPPEMQEGNSECVRDVWAVKPLCSGPEEPSASDQSQILCVLLCSASKPGIRTHTNHQTDASVFKYPRCVRAVGIGWQKLVFVRTPEKMDR